MNHPVTHKFSVKDLQVPFHKSILDHPILPSLDYNDYVNLKRELQGFVNLSTFSRLQPGPYGPWHVNPQRFDDLPMPSAPDQPRDPRCLFRSLGKTTVFWFKPQTALLIKTTIIRSPPFLSRLQRIRTCRPGGWPMWSHARGADGARQELWSAQLGKAEIFWAKAEGHGLKWFKDHVTIKIHKFGFKSNNMRTFDAWHHW